MKKIILGSNSPRRRELLGSIFSDLIVDPETSFVESHLEGIAPEEEPLIMSQGKSRGFHRPLENDEILITADTVVIIDDKVLGKPKNREDAINMLQTLSGRDHKVVTAVTVRSIGKMTSFTDTTVVSFSKLEKEEIEYYIDKYRPFDKAGSYGVQEWIGYVAISAIQGSFYNVMGLPTEKLYRKLKEEFL